MIAEMNTESAITLEFMESSDRDSFTSSIYNFAKSEEISELMEDAYPPYPTLNTSVDDLPESSVSSSTEKLIYC